MPVRSRIRPPSQEETDVAALQTALLGTQLTSALVLRTVGGATTEYLPPRHECPAI